MRVGPARRMITLSRGPGRLQRRLLELLEAAPDRRLNREQLELVLVEGEGHYASNVLRAIRGLARKHHVGFTDRRRKEDSLVSLPREVEWFTEDEVFLLLSEIGGEE